MNGTFLYVFEERDMEYLVERGAQVVYSDPENQVFGFISEEVMADPSSAMYLADTDYVRSDTAYF